MKPPCTYRSALTASHSRIVPSRTASSDSGFSRREFLRLGGATVLGASALGASAVALSSCSSASSARNLAASGTSRPLTIWASNFELATVQRLAEQFTQETGVEVNAIQRNYEGQMLQDFLTQVPTGEGPDIVVVPHDVIGQLVVNGAVAPLDIADAEKLFIPVAVESITYDSRLWGMPFSLENVALIRNNALTQLTPRTFDQLVREGRRLKREGKTKYTLAVKQSDTTGDPYHVYPIQSSFGAEVFTRTPEGEYTTQLGLKGEPGYRFAEYFARMGADGDILTTMTEDIAKQAFLDGEAAFYLEGAWQLPDIQARGMDITVLPTPSAGGEKARPFVGVKVFVINSNASSPLAARRFVLDYLSTVDAQVQLYRDVQRPPALLEAMTKVTEPELKEYARIAQEDGVPMPAIPEMAAVWRFWGATQTAIAKGDGDPHRLWDDMVTNIEGAINQ